MAKKEQIKWTNNKNTNENNRKKNELIHLECIFRIVVERVSIVRISWVRIDDGLWKWHELGKLTQCREQMQVHKIVLICWIYACTKYTNSEEMCHKQAYGEFWGEWDLHSAMINVQTVKMLSRVEQSCVRAASVSMCVVCRQSNCHDETWILIFVFFFESENYAAFHFSKKGE